MIEEGAELSPRRETLHLSSISLDAHPIHHGPDPEVGAYDRDAILSLREGVRAAADILPDKTVVVFGGHSARHPRMVLDRDVYPGDLTPAELNKKLLDQQRRVLEESVDVVQKEVGQSVKINYGFVSPREEEEGCDKEIYILFGVEADITIDAEGNVGIEPPPEVLAKAGLHMITASIHYDETFIKDTSPESIAKALEYVFTLQHEGRGLVNRVAHCFKELRQVYDADKTPDKSEFARLMAIARDNMVAIELNADKGFDAEILQFLVENGNWLDFGSDHHAFKHWVKQGRLPESLLTEEEQRIAEVNARHNRYWNYWWKILDEGTTRHRGLKALFTDGDLEKIRERIHRFCQHRTVAERRSEENMPEFERQRDELVTQILGPFPPGFAIGRRDKETWEWTRLRRILTTMYDLWPLELNGDQAGYYRQGFSQLEAKYAQVPLGMRDTMALFRYLHEAKLKVGIPPKLFVSAWMIESQAAFYKKEPLPPQRI
jgi:histidinol phosphatase-like PHP family hydrolase